MFVLLLVLLLSCNVRHLIICTTPGSATYSVKHGSSWITEQHQTPATTPLPKPQRQKQQQQQLLKLLINPLLALPDQWLV